MKKLSLLAAKELVPEEWHVELSDVSLRSDDNDPSITDYTEGFKHTFTAIYRLVEVKKK